VNDLDMNDDKEKKEKYSYSGSHRFEAPEEGAAKDYEKEREFHRKQQYYQREFHRKEEERKRTFEESKKKSEEINKKYMEQLFGPEITKEQKNNETFSRSLKIFIFGFLCCFGSMIYYITERVISLPLLIFFSVGLIALILGGYLSYKNFMKI
jgi:hypothetical protein